MLINPQTAITERWITGVNDNPSPNAIDFSMDIVYTIDSASTFYLDSDNKKMRGGKKIKPSDGMYTIEANTSYDILSDMFVALPEGIVALLIIRSTLSRNGLFLTSGLYDAGFAGNIGCALHNLSGPAMLQQGICIGQIMFMTSDSNELYLGGYNHQPGSHPNH